MPMEANAELRTVFLGERSTAITQSLLQFLSGETLHFQEGSLGFVTTFRNKTSSTCARAPCNGEQDVVAAPSIWACRIVVNYATSYELAMYCAKCKYRRDGVAGYPIDDNNEAIWSPRSTLDPPSPDFLEKRCGTSQILYFPSISAGLGFLEVLGETPEGYLVKDVEVNAKLEGLSENLPYTYVPCAGYKCTVSHSFREFIDRATLLIVFDGPADFDSKLRCIENSNILGTMLPIAVVPYGEHGVSHEMHSDLERVSGNTPAHLGVDWDEILDWVAQYEGEYRLECSLIRERKSADTGAYVDDRALLGVAGRYGEPLECVVKALLTGDPQSVLVPFYENQSALVSYAAHDNSTGYRVVVKFKGMCALRAEVSGNKVHPVAEESLVRMHNHLYANSVMRCFSKGRVVPEMTGLTAREFAPTGTAEQIDGFFFAAEQVEEFLYAHPLAQCIKTVEIHGPFSRLQDNVAVLLFPAQGDSPSCIRKRTAYKQCAVILCVEETSDLVASKDEVSLQNGALMKHVRGCSEAIVLLTERVPADSAHAVACAIGACGVKENNLLQGIGGFGGLANPAGSLRQFIRASNERVLVVGPYTPTDFATARSIFSCVTSFSESLPFSTSVNSVRYCRGTGPADPFVAIARYASASDLALRESECDDDACGTFPFYDRGVTGRSVRFNATCNAACDTWFEALPFARLVESVEIYGEFDNTHGFDSAVLLGEATSSDSLLYSKMGNGDTLVRVVGLSECTTPSGEIDFESTSLQFSPYSRFARHIVCIDMKNYGRKSPSMSKQERELAVEYFEMTGVTVMEAVSDELIAFFAKNLGSRDK